MGLIFISYRREDTQKIAGKIYEKLRERFGNDAVFLDVYDIPVGIRFDKHIEGSLREAPVFLELIGPNWVTEADAQGNLRLNQPNDMLHTEIKMALRFGLPIIPVFIDTKVPEDRLLPRDIHIILKFNGVFMRSDQFDVGMSSLIAAIEFRIPDDTEYRYRFFNGVKVLLPPIDKIQAGAFTMGDDAHENERPAHQVTLAEFYMARYPVTVEEYVLFLQATQHSEPPANGGVFWAKQQSQPHHPVVNVSWNEAVAYAEWLRGLSGQKWRLPSEAEWEKSARGTDGRGYPWSSEWNQAKANTVEGQRHTTTRVKAYPGGKSIYGVFDMTGNVWEWTASLNRPYSDSAHTKSDDLKSIGQRIRRGGSWQEDHTFATTTRRLGDDPAICRPNVGFRLALG